MLSFKNISSIKKITLQTLGTKFTAFYGKQKTQITYENQCMASKKLSASPLFDKTKLTVTILEDSF